MPDEKGFCEVLSEQIIDEKKATDLYKHLLDLLEQEESMLAPLPKEPVARMNTEIMLELIRKDLENISGTEAVHSVTLDSIRKALCV